MLAGGLKCSRLIELISKMDLRMRPFRVLDHRSEMPSKMQPVVGTLRTIWQLEVTSEVTLSLLSVGVQ